MDQGDGTFAPVPLLIAEMLHAMQQQHVMTSEDVQTLWPRLFCVGEDVEDLTHELHGLRLLCPTCRQAVAP